MNLPPIYVNWWFALARVQGEAWLRLWGLAPIAPAPEQRREPEAERPKPKLRVVK